MEILIGAIGGCIAVTTRAYAQRKNWSLEDIAVEVEMELCLRGARADYLRRSAYG
jgi:uncharacterized OsmC-like protein